MIAFCKGTGLRREGVENVKGKDLMSRQEINAEIARIETIRAEKTNRCRENDANDLQGCTSIYRSIT